MVWADSDLCKPKNRISIHSMVGYKHFAASDFGTLYALILIHSYKMLPISKF